MTSGPLVTVSDGDETTRYRVVAAHFEDTTTFFPMLGQYEVWQLINLTGDTHPIHLHLDPFQILARRPIRYEIPEGGIGDRDLAATVTLERDPDDELDHAIDENERGLKDTIRVNPNEIVEIAVRFTTYSGRYMYHCHILEHEDRDMMRPFVTMPAGAHALHGVTLGPRREPGGNVHEPCDAGSSLPKRRCWEGELDNLNRLPGDRRRRGGRSPA